MRLLLIAFVCTIFSSVHGHAQIAVQNNGIAYISGSGDIFFINGSLTNASTAALTNNGALHVQQDLTNYQASMATGTGTLYLNGSALQTVAGNQVFKTHNLVTNNAAGFTLNNDLSVNGAHTFTAGILATSATPNYLIYQAGASYSGDADSKHVNGWVKKFGNTAFTFPVGNASLERTIGITGLSVTSEFNAKYNSTTPNTTQLLSPLVSLDGAEYWALNKVTGGSASVAMNWDNSKVPFPNWVLSDVTTANYSGSLWTSQGGSATGSTTAIGNITSNSISSFNLFTFGSRSYVVPLTLLSFTATKAGDEVHVNWQTTNEFNVDHFTVERSDDGVNFYPVDQAAARNTMGLENYLFIDKTPVGQIVYYRLRSVDIDGKAKLSAVVTIRSNAGNDQLTLIGNPVHDHIVVAAGARMTGVFDYKINAVNGQFMQQGKIAVSNGGQYQFALNKAIKPGSYILTVRDKDRVYTFKVIVI